MRIYVVSRSRRKVVPILGVVLPYFCLVQKRLARHRWAVFVWLLGMLLMGLVTFPNHYNFRTYAYDLGYVAGFFERLLHLDVFTQVFLNNPCEIPHFSYASYIIGVPFYLIGKVWGVLVYQWLFLGLAAIGIYFYARERLQKGAVWAMVHYFGMWGIYAALGFDAHPELIGASLIPWLFYAVEANKKALAFLLFIIMILCKETYALFGISIAATLFLIHRQDKAKVKISLKLALISVAGLVLFFILNGFMEHKTGCSSRFSVMYGYLWSEDAMNAPWSRPDDFASKLRNIIGNWRHILTLFFESYKNDPVYTGIKAEFHYAALLSGGWVLFGAPVFIPALLPVYAHKLLASDPQVWGSLYQYNMELAVLFPLAVIWFASRQPSSYQVPILFIAAILAHFINAALLDYRKSVWITPEHMGICQAEHYTSPYDYRKITAALSKVPPGSSVAAVSRLAPHFDYARHKMYHAFFPGDTLAQYYALLRGDNNPWPLPASKLGGFIDSVMKSPNWTLIYDQDSLVIFRKRALFDGGS